MHTIASASNPLIRVFRRALKEGTTRSGWLAVEGPLLIEEALKVAKPTISERSSASSGAGVSPVNEHGQEARATSVVRSAIATPSAARKFAGLLARLPGDAERVEVSERLFTTLAQTVTPQGIAALVEVTPPSLDLILKLPDAVLVVACGLQDPGNLGAILRAAEAFRVAAVICLKSTVSPSNPKVVRASAGAVFRLPVFAGLEADRFVDQLRRHGVRIVAADPHSPNSLPKADLRGPMALLVGNEAGGLGDDLLRNANVRLSIPVAANVDSLNAAMAAGIFLYEAARQRRLG